MRADGIKVRRIRPRRVPDRAASVVASASLGDRRGVLPEAAGTGLPTPGRVVPDEGVTFMRAAPVSTRKQGCGVTTSLWRRRA